MERENTNLLQDSDENTDFDVNVHRSNNNSMGFTKRAFERGIQRKNDRRKTKYQDGFCTLICAGKSFMLLLMIGAIFVLMWSSASMKIQLDELQAQIQKETSESNSRSNSQEYKEFEKELDEKIQEAKVGENEITVLQKQLISVINQIGYLNKTIEQVKKNLHIPNNMVQLAADVKELKKGMADSGAVNTKVISEINNIKTALQNHDQAIRVLNGIIKNITSDVAKVSGKPIIQPPTALPTLASDIQEKDNIDQQPEKSAVDGMTQHFTEEIDRVFEVIGQVNETLISSMADLSKDLKDTKNSLLEIKTKQTEVSSNSSETSASAVLEHENIKKKLESISTAMNSGLQKHNDSIISLANSLNELRQSTAQIHNNFTTEINVFRQNHLLLVATENITMQQLQDKVQENTKHIEQIEDEIKNLNMSSKGITFQVEKTPYEEEEEGKEEVQTTNTSEKDTSEVTTQPEQFNETKQQNTDYSTSIETITTAQPETSTTNETSSQNNSTQVNNNESNSTSLEQLESDSNSSKPLEGETNLDEQQTEGTQREDGSDKETANSEGNPTGTGEESNGDDNPTRVTRSIPEAMRNEEDADLNSLIEP